MKLHNIFITILSVLLVTYAASAYLTPLVTVISGQGLFADGTLLAPSVSFVNAPGSGLYRIAAHDIGYAVDQILGLEMKKSTGAFVNIGLGGAASGSDGVPFFIQRAQDSSAVAFQISNNVTSANASAQIQLSTDINNGGLLGAYTTSSTVPPYVSAFVIRSMNSSHHVNIMGGENSGDDVGIWTNGDFTSAGITAKFNGDHSTTLSGLLQLPVQASSSTPTCGSGQSGSLALTSLFKLCVCNGTAWKNASDGSTSCTF